MTVELFDTVPKQYENSIFKMLCDADKDFIPALSTRNSTTQGDFSGSADADKPYAYFETVKSQAALLCTENGKLLGFMSFVKNRILEIDGKYCSAVYLSTLIVDKTARGKGISKLLYNRLLSEYADKNIITRTWSSNVAHLNLLEKMGFCLLYTIKNDRGEGIDTVYFGKMANRV